jgi:hypothetical protein
LIFVSVYRMRRSGERSTPLGQMALPGDGLTRREVDCIRRLGKTTRQPD